MNYFISKIDTGKFDGKDPIRWIFQMKQFFDLHQVPSLQRVTIASLYLEMIIMFGINGFLKEKRILSSIGPFL
jgi:hypothetical protein